tara:strand:+ start:105 stop:950 length:846 start_codon:yes stop_codon:yes gene_type:complete
MKKLSTPRPFRIWLLFAIQVVMVMTVFLCGVCAGLSLIDGRSEPILMSAAIFDISTIKSAMDANRTMVFSFVAAWTSVIVATFIFLTQRLTRQLKAATDVLVETSVNDPLTGLANRRYFFERLEQEVDRAVRYKTNLSLIMIDIDNFRKINDELGAQYGDLALTEVSRLLAANIRTSDIIARYGGEEFAILIPALDVNKAAMAAEKLRNVVEVNDLTMEGPRLKVTISAGVADLESIESMDGPVREHLIRSAEDAMYKAKSLGRNCVVAHKRIVEKQLPLL